VTLLPGAEEAINGLIVGKVGLALSGGGFRAAYDHLGVLACLAERDVLHDLDVLSCVSGGSIVGACYWLKLRERMLRAEPLKDQDYIKLVEELILHFIRLCRKTFGRKCNPMSPPSPGDYYVVGKASWILKPPLPPLRSSSTSRFGRIRVRF
jgi:hypothetical protein